MSEPRAADHPIDALFLERWSPRAFGPEAMSEAELMRLFEAARWAPSAYNAQPWRFIYALRGDDRFPALLDLLVPGNQAWASRAAALVFVASKTTMVVRGSDEEKPSHTHSFDAGAAWGFLALQAHLAGWATHGMSGVDFPRAATELGVPDGYRLEAAFAVGRPGDKTMLDERYQAMEAPNGRNPVATQVYNGRFGG